MRALLSAFWIAEMLVAFTGRCNAAPPVQVTVADANRQIVLRAGQELVVNLESNRSTGYGWFLSEVVNPVLTSLGKPVYNRNSTLPGASGLESWRFQATKAGNEKLKLEYRRPWERNLPAAKTVLFDVSVK
jgi:inhibitor of cysteine peptidase